MYLPGLPAHVVQRGNNRSACFLHEDDYRFYLAVLGEAVSHHRVVLHAYVLMTNHVHLLMMPADTVGISKINHCDPFNVAQTRRAMLDLQHESEQRAAALTQELKKAEQRNRLMALTAPVDGTVQQLAIHTQGGVVTEAQPLMVIVPSDAPVEVEAMLENKDIGFVRPGQEVEIKVETFTFTKYGVINGTVTSISNDAIEDEKLGLVYSARIRLHESRIRVGGKDIALSPGMAVRAEVKTDKRKVIDYFLSQFKEYQDESLEER
jgi:hemolysin D